MIFLVFWCTLVYDLVAHWVWSVYIEIDPNTQAAVVRRGWLKELGVLDFAGGTVVHVSSGFSALALAIITGKRADFNENKQVKPSNVPMTLLGAAMLWFGWFGFNGGSALSANGVAGNAFMASQICAATASFIWMILEWIVSRKSFSAVGASIGAIVGLVVITPAAGFVDPIMALPIGAIGTALTFGFIQLRTRFWLVDDTLDVFTCHGIGGMLGSLLTGLFADKRFNADGDNGAFYGNGRQFGLQLLAVVVVGIVSFAFSFLFALALRFTIGLRSDEPQGQFKVTVNVDSEMGEMKEQAPKESRDE